MEVENIRNIDWPTEFESYAHQLLAAYQTPGAVVAMARDGEPICEFCFGRRNLELGLPVTLDTVFGVGSITKSLTCVAIMQLQEQAKLAVRDPVVKYLPEYRTANPEYARRTTIHHFMTHTAGLPPLPTLHGAMLRSMQCDPAAQERLEKLGDRVRPIDTYEQLMEAIAADEQGLLGAPGERFSYSNDAYALLGAIIERVSGKPYTTYIEECILRPAGMTRSTFGNGHAGPEQGAGPSGDVTTLYHVRWSGGVDEVIAAPIWWDAPAMRPAGFLRSSAREMIRFLEIFRTGGMVGSERILSATSVEAMTRRYGVGCQPGMEYGYGLALTPEYHGCFLVDHGGNLKGIAAWVMVVPGRGLTGVALTNQSGAPAGQLLLSALNSALGVPVETRRWAPPDYPCPPDLLPRYAGVYPSGEGATVKVAVEDRRLAFEVDGRAWPARPVGDHLFAVKVKELEAPARFLLDDGGEVYALEQGFRIIRKQRG